MLWSPLCPTVRRVSLSVLPLIEKRISSPGRQLKLGGYIRVLVPAELISHMRRVVYLDDLRYKKCPLREKTYFLFYFLGKIKNNYVTIYTYDMYIYCNFFKNR